MAGNLCQSASTLAALAILSAEHCVRQRTLSSVVNLGYGKLKRPTYNTRLWLEMPYKEAYEVPAAVSLQAIRAHS